MKELVLPFTCEQAKWATLLFLPAVFLAGIVTMYVPMIFLGGFFGGILCGMIGHDFVKETMYTRYNDAQFVLYKCTCCGTEDWD